MHMQLQNYFKSNYKTCLKSCRDLICSSSDPFMISPHLDKQLRSFIDRANQFVRRFVDKLDYFLSSFVGLLTQRDATILNLKNLFVPEVT